ncbi:MAG: ATP-binding protein [Nitrososphaeria archaeon]|nr:ATP-binding protein [Nitrososphaeria archaeon]
MSVRLGFRLRDNVPYFSSDVFCFPLDCFGRHACVFGRTGSGKSTTAKIVLYELLRNGVSVLVFDRVGEFNVFDCGRVLVPGEGFRVAPLAFEGDDVVSGVESIVSLFNNFFFTTYFCPLSPLQARVLRDVLEGYYYRFSEIMKVSRLVEEIKVVQSRYSRVKGWVEGCEALVSRLYPFSKGVLAKVFDSSEDSLDRVLFDGLTIVDLSVLPTDEAKNFLTNIVCDRVYRLGKRLEPSNRLKLVIVVDEAHNVAPYIPNYIGVLEKIAIELRKYGISLITVSTRPTLVSKNIIANSNLIISHSLTSNEDIRLVLNYMVNELEQESFIPVLRTLNVGEALVQANLPEYGCRAIKVKVGLPEHEHVISARPRYIQKEEGEKVYDELSKVCDQIPAYVKRILYTIACSGENLTVKSLPISKRKLKEIAYTYNIIEVRGDKIILTEYGSKIARRLLAIK